MRNYEGGENELGGEPTPEKFVEKLVLIFREVKRTLKSDGTLWFNLGDSYCGGGGYCPNAPSNLAGSKQSSAKGTATFKRPVPIGYKPKDLAGIPWMTATALRKDGWYLRQDIIWEKSNHMPERVSDRPTRNHEYIFLMSKSKKYLYRSNGFLVPSTEGKLKNCRSVWRMPTSGYHGAHFAVFPLTLPERCVLLSTDEGHTVLDPFSGSATTGIAALKHGRRFVGVDLKMSYIDLCKSRLDYFLETGKATGPKNLLLANKDD